jgi:hypothetical protein
MPRRSPTGRKPAAVVCGFPRYDVIADTGRSLSWKHFAAGESPIVFGLGSSAVMVAGNFWRAAIVPPQH